jgi:hypothetical protein
MDKPSENLFSECLAAIDLNVLVCSIVMVVVYQEGGVRPENKPRMLSPCNVLTN